MSCRTTKTRPRLLRIRKALQYLDNVVSEGTLRNWICAGRISVVRIGGVVCISTDVLDELISGDRSSTNESAKLQSGARP